MDTLTTRIAGMFAGYGEGAYGVLVELKGGRHLLYRAATPERRDEKVSLFRRVRFGRVVSFVPVDIVG